MLLITFEEDKLYSLTCCHFYSCLSVWDRRVSEVEAWEIQDKRKEEENHNLTKKENCAVLCMSTCKCACTVCASAWEDSWAEHTGRGTLFLPSSYSYVCLQEVGWQEKRKEKEWYSHIREHVTHTQLYGFWRAAINFSLLVYCLSDSECKVSLSILPFSLWLAVTSTPLLLSARLNPYLWNDDWAQDSKECLIWGGAQ